MKPSAFFILLAACLTLPIHLPAQNQKPEKRKKEKPVEPATKEKPSTFPAPDEVVAAMKKAASYFRTQVSFAGGYAWSWPQDMSIAKGENSASPSLIVMQPPGTPSVGLAMLEAYRATGDVLFLQAAREAAHALIWCQLASGGWDSDFDFDPRKAGRYHFRRDLEAGDTERSGRHGDSTLDDDKTQSALLFLLELAHMPECASDAELQKAVKFGFDGLLAAQAPIGGWGQHYDGPEHAKAPVIKASFPTEWSRKFPAVDYTRNYTLNDNNLLHVIKLLLRAHELTKDEKYLAAARKTGDFLLLARLPAPQPAWAQQYNEAMQPVWARKFEPPAVCTTESIGALEALLELWIATGDKKYLEPHTEVIAWLEKSRLPDGKWPRFYEMGTNKPLYCKANTYEVTYDDSDLPTHYGFKIDTAEKDIAKLKTLLSANREDLLARRVGPVDAKAWASKAKSQATKVVTALKSQSKRGCWIAGDEIDAGEFVKNIRAMAIYVEAAKKGGEQFESIRKKTPQSDPSPPKQTN